MDGSLLLSLRCRSCDGYFSQVSLCFLCVHVWVNVGHVCAGAEDTDGRLDLELQVSEPSYIGSGNPVNVLEEQQDTLRHESVFRSVGNK